MYTYVYVCIYRVKGLTLSLPHPLRLSLSIYIYIYGGAVKAVPETALGDGLRVLPGQNELQLEIFLSLSP